MARREFAADALNHNGVVDGLGDVVVLRGLASNGLPAATAPIKGNPGGTASRFPRAVPAVMRIAPFLARARK